LDRVRFLAEFAPQDGPVLAGGQSLVPMMNFRLARPAFLIDLNAGAGLDRLAVEDVVLRIGARVR
jgi:carbon-monoxide dehydrogenase medium subunit